MRGQFWKEPTCNQSFFAHLSQGMPYRSATHLTCAARQDPQLLTVRFPPMRFLVFLNGTVDGGAIGRGTMRCLRGVLPFFDLQLALSLVVGGWLLGSIMAGCQAASTQ